ncbi:MAG: hypothetical protein C4527_11005 [Candidatus Omnitrophota bacterium]|jgi:nitrate reductase gamma subunit|nr:MAG: hypothetical protein C4527_11005 [Candidatus Omnitrophota bacterium]
MEQMLNFAQGPLFRLAFAVLVVGLLRRAILMAWPAYVAWRRARDQSIRWSNYFKDLESWLFPLTHAMTSRLVFTAVSYFFHVGLILVPIFLADHVSLWTVSISLTLPALPKSVADILTILTMAGVTFLLVSRFVHPMMRKLSKWEDYTVLILILFAFISGYVAGRSWNPISYNAMLLLHVVSAEILMMAVPFTKLSHCILFPFARLCSEIGSKLASDINYTYVSPITRGKRP